MKIVVAPNALKGCLDADAAARAMEKGIRRVVPDARVIRKPMADGGDGLSRILSAEPGFSWHKVTVHDPLGRRIEAGFLFEPATGTAVIEAAAACGLALLDEDERDPMRTGSRGAGELMLAALDAGAGRVVVGIGGTATHDAAMGLCAALGIRFLDARGGVLPGCGGNMARVADILLEGVDPRLREVEITLAVDVDNPLVGPRGAALFAPQKGADEDTCQVLERATGHFAARLAVVTGVDVGHLPGAGAGGGIAGTLHAVFGAGLVSGAEWVAERIGLSASLAGADLVLTSEGRLDRQTLHGKAPLVVADHARRAGVPCVALVGALEEGFRTLHECGLNAAFSFTPGPLSLDQAMRHAEGYLADGTEQIIRLYSAASSEGGQDGAEGARE